MRKRQLKFTAFKTVLTIVFISRVWNWGQLLFAFGDSIKKKVNSWVTTTNCSLLLAWNDYGPLFVRFEIHGASVKLLWNYRIIRSNYLRMRHMIYLKVQRTRTFLQNNQILAISLSFNIKYQYPSHIVTLFPLVV